MRDDPTSRKTLAVLATGFGLYLILYLSATVSRGDPWPFGDFFAIWSYPRMPVGVLYDPAALHDAQMALGMPAVEHNPFPYPPPFILMLAPLAPFAYLPAYLLWMTTTLSLYVVAIAAGTGMKRLLVPAALLAPTTTINLMAGQSGFLSAGLLIGGLRLMTARPAAAGVLFGLLAYKPQFGVMVPVALVALGNWRCIAATCATVGILSAMATIAFGFDVWAAWWHSLPAYVAHFDTLTVRFLMPTVTENLRLLGIPAPIVSGVQAAVSLAMAIAVWFAFRRFPTARAIPVLLAATCLATPHAFIYDLPMLTGAVLLHVAERVKSGAAPPALEQSILVLVLVFPAAMAFGLRAPVSSIALSLFMALMLVRQAAFMRPPQARPS